MHLNPAEFGCLRAVRGLFFLLRQLCSHIGIPISAREPFFNCQTPVFNGIMGVWQNSQTTLHFYFNRTSLLTCSPNCDCTKFHVELEVALTDAARTKEDPRHVIHSMDYKFDAYWNWIKTKLDLGLAVGIRQIRGEPRRRISRHGRFRKRVLSNAA